MRGKLFIALRLFSKQLDKRYIPIVNWISSFAIAIGLASVLIVLSVMNGFQEEIYNKILRSEPHLMLQNQSDSESMIIPCSDLEFSDLLKCKSYSKISAIAESDSLIQAVEIRSYSHSETSTLMLGNNEAMIDESLAGVLDIEYGSYLTISIPRVMNNRLTLRNAPSFRVKGFHAEKEIGANPLEIVVNSETFKNLDSENLKENHMILWLKDPFDIESMTTKIEPIIGPYQYEITDWIEKNENLFRAILIEKAVMTGLLFLVVLIAIFNVMVMISMTIESKKGDIAILKSLGYNQRDVTQIFLIQGCIANFIGILLGLMLSLAVLFNLNHIEEISRNIFNFDFFPPGLYILDTMPYVIKLHEFIWICTATVFIGLLASYLPSRITLRYSVPDLMRLYRS
ncbi:MAG TPA: hypothetical protein DCL68_03170 [Gammaproteobacteria bacterium]|nr:hypothetical protein [Gammaproteobacteria bacterium]